jgi:membrane protein required for colicin V production
MDWLHGLSWVDWTLLGVLALSMVIGLVRGFVFECMSLAGWLVAWFAAQWAAPWVAAHVQVAAAASPVNHGLGFALAFVAALLAWAVLARLIRMLIHATPLSLPDRLLGAGFGVLRGGVLLLAVATVVAMTPAAQSTIWRSSQGARWLAQTLQALRPLLPGSAAHLIVA